MPTPAKPATPDNDMGFKTGSNLLRRQWLLITTGLLLTVGICLAYLGLIRDSNIQHAHITATSKTHAQLQAASIDQRLQQLEQRLRLSLTLQPCKVLLPLTTCSTYTG